MIKLYYIITFLLLMACSSINPEHKSKYSDSEIGKIVDSHGQELTVESLKLILSSDKFDEIDKDFVRYYVYRYVDDPKLHNYIDKEMASDKAENIYTFLLKANTSKDSSVYNLNFQKAKSIDENNIYILMEIISSSVDEIEKKKCLRKISDLDFNNDIVLTFNIRESRLDQDTINYLTYFNTLKKVHDNYYSNFIVADEYQYQSKPDSAVLFYKKSLIQKENIGACLHLSELLYQIYHDESASDYFLQKALAINEQDEEAMDVLAWRYFDKKDSMNARKTFEKMINKNPSITNHENYLLFLLCTNQIEEGRRYYIFNIEKNIPKEQQSAYYLVFGTLQKRKDLNKFYLEGDSVQKIYGLVPIEYSNRIINTVLESIHKWQ